MDIAKLLLVLLRLKGVGLTISVAIAVTVDLASTNATAFYVVNNYAIAVAIATFSAALL